MIAGVCFIVFTSFIHVFSDSPRHIRTGRSLPDAVVFAALSESPHSPDSLRYMLHPEILHERHVTRSNSAKHPKTETSQKPAPDVEIVKSIEMEFDAVLHKFVPVKRIVLRGRDRDGPKDTKPKKSSTPAPVEMPLLTQKTSSDLREILWKYHRERMMQKPGLSEAKNFQTGRFKHGSHAFPSGGETGHGPGITEVPKPERDPSWPGYYLGGPDKSKFLKFYLKNWKKGSRSPGAYKLLF